MEIALKKETVTVLIIDDEERDENLMRKLIQQFNRENNAYSVEVIGSVLEYRKAHKEYTSYQRAAVAMIEEMQPDVVLLDIKMDNSDTAAYNVLGEFDSAQKTFEVILITAFWDLVLVGFKTDIVGVYLKDSSFNQFQLCLKAAIHNIEAKKANLLLDNEMIEFEGRNGFKLLPSNVVCFESAANYSHITYLKRDTLMAYRSNPNCYEVRQKLIYGTLAKISLKFPNFLRVHNTVLANPKFFHRFDEAQNILYLNQQSPIELLGASQLPTLKVSKDKIIRQQIQDVVKSQSQRQSQSQIFSFQQLFHRFFHA